MELADRAFRNPVFVLGFLGAFVLLGHFLGRRLFVLLTLLVLGRWFVVVVVISIAFGTKGVAPFDAALDDQSSGVGELNGNVFLFDAREFTNQFVGVFLLADIEFGSERADGGCMTGSSAACG